MGSQECNTYFKNLEFSPFGNWLELKLLILAENSCVFQNWELSWMQTVSPTACYIFCCCFTVGADQLEFCLYNKDNLISCGGWWDFWFVNDRVTIPTDQDMRWSCSCHFSDYLSNFFFSDAKLQVWFSWVRSRSLHKLNQWSPQSLKKFQIQLFSLIKVCTVGVYFSQLMTHYPKHSAWKSRLSPCAKFLLSPQATTMPFWSAPLGHIKQSDRTAVKCKISVHLRFSLQWIS